MSAAVIGLPIDLLNAESMLVVWYGVSVRDASPGNSRDKIGKP